MTTKLVSERPRLSAANWFYAGQDIDFIYLVAGMSDAQLAIAKQVARTRLNADDEVIQDILSIIEARENLLSNVVK